MKPRFLLLLPLVLCVPTAWSQAAASTAELAFAELQAVSRPIPPAPPRNGNKKTRQEFEADQKRQSGGFLHASDKAREFYQRYPGHAKAAEAKKIEVVSLLRAVQTGAVEKEPQALRLGSEFRKDKKNASRDRYHVATTMLQMEVAKKKLGRKELMQEYERRAFGLYGEFPQEPAVFDMFIGLARNAEPAKGRALAERILRMPAPDAVKKEAKSLIERLDLPGKAVAFEWQDENGKHHKISDYKGSAVVFYVWASWAPTTGATRTNVAHANKAGVVVVPVNVDTDVAKGKAAAKDAGAGSPGYYDERGFASPLPRQLKAATAPSIHVVDPNGVYVGSGSPNELESLLAQAGR